MSLASVLKRTKGTERVPDGSLHIPVSESYPGLSPNLLTSSWYSSSDAEVPSSKESSFGPLLTDRPGAACPRIPHEEDNHHRCSEMA